MRREGGTGLLHRDPMSLLLQSASLYPTFDILGVTRIGFPETPDGVEDGAKHPDVAVDCPSSEVARTSTDVKAGLPKIDALHNVHLRPPSLVTVMKKTNDVRSRSDFEGRSRGKTARRSVRTGSQKFLKIASQTILLSGIAGPLSVLTKLGVTHVEIRTLYRKRFKNRAN